MASEKWAAGTRRSSGAGVEAKEREEGGLTPQHITHTWASWRGTTTAGETDTTTPTHQHHHHHQFSPPPPAALKTSRTQQQQHLTLQLRSPNQKVAAIRNQLVQRIVQEARQLPSNNQSIMSIAFLAFGVILFDVLGDAIFGSSTNLMAALGVSPPSRAREILLPGIGLFGDNLNNLAEVALNMITIYLYRDESPDCGERLLCESNQQAVSRGFIDSLVTYVSGFAVSFFLHEAPLSRNLHAMRAGRKGQNCIELYPTCSITL
ncbi:hypothetical protein Pmani_012884 [Petrolisthes manimaculis]|uniref:Uncharacterized protein n=1 Tax=Petrolisthes manimaculis TaxID=1843537 RepID=A0AAE1PX30_9EUCA|nr:hypothetical protein Pmani_012884 [Petrolisthes manimaculis]